MTPLVEQARSEVTRLCLKYQVKRLDLIGSALRGDFDVTRSDVDFVVEFEDPTRDAADRYLGLLVDLEDLFQRRVDLVSYRGIRNPYFKREVDETRVVLCGFGAC